MLLLCLECKAGTLRWVDPDVTSLEGDMKCPHCDFVYNGKDDYQRQQQREEAIENEIKYEL